MCCAVCVFTNSLAAYFVTCCVNGFLRSVVFTVPYIVITKIVQNEQVSEQLSE